MKGNPIETLTSKLNRIKGELEVLTHPESKADLLKNLDELITTLNRLRDGLTNPSLADKAGEIQRPLEQVVSFLEFAKSNEVIAALLSPAKKAKTPKPKKLPVEIADDLTNEQIRTLLDKDLSKAELKAVASQRSISIGKLNNDEIKRSILKNLERQEGYERLSAS